jgi:(p)ppGpp synthase/HD superfamily hydrolase
MQTVTLETFERALIYAIQKHSGVTRKGVDAVGFRRPYILHPLSVMQRIFNNKVSKNIYLLATAAVLHDVVEDCFEDRNEGLGEIAKLFGWNIAAIVDELTLDKEKYKTIGKKEYLAQELNIMSSYALAIKLCDRLDNVSDLDTMPEDFRNNYIAETEYILGKLNRKLSDSHRKLIAEIYLTLESYKVAA